jgi:DNA-binding transcriptional LysR family regulator
LRILCHPQIAHRHRDKELAAFVQANELVHVRIADEPRHGEWSRLMLQAGLGALKVERGLVFDTATLAVQYLLSGEGIALMDTRLFARETRSGRLASPFEETLETGYCYYLVTHAEGLADTAISLFRSWLIERVGAGS